MRFTGIILTAGGLLSLLLCGCPEPAPMGLAVSDTQHEFDTGDDVWQLEVWNTGNTGGQLAFAVEADQPWVMISPAGGTSGGPTDRARVSIQLDPSAFDGTAKTATISVMATGLATKTASISVPAIWERTYPDIREVRSSDNIEQLEPAALGGYYAYVDSENYEGASGNSKHMLLRTDASGNMLWKAVPPPYGRASGILALAGGGCLVYGTQYWQAAFEFNRYTSEGAVTATSIQADFALNYRCRGIHTPSGGFAWVGSSSSSSVAVFVCDEGITNYAIHDIDASLTVLCFAAAADGGFLLMGESSSSSVYKPVLVRTDSMGVIQWTTQLSDTTIESIGNVLAMPDGTWRIVIKGYAPSTYFLEVLSISDSGQLTAAYDMSTSATGVYSLVAAAFPDGTLAVAGNGTSSSKMYRFVAKVDLEGNVAWTHSSPRTAQEGYDAIAVGADGNIAVAGSSATIIPEGAEAAYWEAKLEVMTPAGQLVGEQRYTMSTGQGDVYNEDVERIVAAPTGGHMVATSIWMSNVGSIGAGLLRIGDNGDTIWRTTLTGSTVADLDITANDRAWVLLSEDSTSGSLVIPYDSSGTAGVPVELPTTYDATYSAILAGTDGGFVVAGSYGTASAIGIVASVFSETGAMQWTARAPTRNDMSPVRIVRSTDGGFAVLLKSSYYSSGLAGIKKFDAHCVPDWTWSSAEIPYPVALAAFPNGDYCVIGYQRTGSRYVPTAARVSADGKTLWEHPFSFALNALPLDAALTSAGDLAIVENSGFGQCILMGLSPDGEDEWLRGVSDDFTHIASARGGGLALAGSSSADYNSDVLISRVTSRGYGLPQTDLKRFIIEETR